MKKVAKEVKEEIHDHGQDCCCEGDDCGDDCCGECGPVESCGMHYCRQCAIPTAVFGLLFVLAGLGYLPSVINGWVLLGVFLLVAGILAIVKK